MNTKHTPGPWFLGEMVSDRGPCVVGDGDSVVCEFTGAGPSVEADARLIAAAPELMEALILLEKEMVASGNASSVDYGWKPAIEKTRAAIAKATGEQP